jgi:two-component system, OmpR family, response regulator
MDGPATSPPARPLILIAGISRDAREMYRDYFRWSGWSVLLASSSLMAFDLAAARQPDIVATCDRLRPRDGLLLCEQLHADPRTSHIPVVILMTATTTLDRQRAELAGCATILLQPALPKLLFAEARRLVARAGRSRTLGAADGAQAAPSRPPSRRRVSGGQTRQNI